MSKPRETTMVYRCPGTMLEVDGIRVDYLIVFSDEVDEALANGWSLTVLKAFTDATAGLDDDPAPEVDAPPPPVKTSRRR